MKNLGLLILIVFWLSSTGFAATIVLVADAWPPYNNAEGETEKGYVVDIAEAIFAKQGHEIVYKIRPWKVAVEETRKGTYDGLIGADTEDGSGFIFPEEEIGSYLIGFFVKKGNPWRFTNTQSLEKVKLGVAEGYGYNPWLHDYIQSNKKDYTRVQSVSGDHPLVANINKLLAGIIDVTPATATTVFYTAKTMGVFDQIQFAGSGGAGRNVYLVFSPAKESSKEYAQILDHGLHELRASGQLAKILARYGLSDWK
jgi:polar amino acid transport system substrate-binding protein